MVTCTVSVLGVINLFGGYPTKLCYEAALLSSHGFAALELQFYGHPGHPKTYPSLGHPISQDLSYFDKAVKFMRDHPDIRNDPGFAVKARCGAVPLALLMAVHVEGIKCVCCINGVNMVSYGEYTYKGERFLPFSPYDEKRLFGIFSSGKTVKLRKIMTETYFNSKHEPSSVIPFEHRKDISYMFVAGLDDDEVPAEEFLNLSEKRLRQANHPDFKILRFPGAGHQLEAPYSPHNHVVDFGWYLRDWGGKTVPHCKAQVKCWTEYIDFVHKVLCDTKK